MESGTGLNGGDHGRCEPSRCHVGVTQTRRADGKPPYKLTKMVVRGGRAIGQGGRRV